MQPIKIPSFNRKLVTEMTFIFWKIDGRLERDVLYADIYKQLCFQRLKQNNCPFNDRYKTTVLSTIDTSHL